ncbi:MAG: hypothetical protein ABII18_03025 [bacterium]
MQIEINVPTRSEFQAMVRDSGQEVTDQTVANLAYKYSSVDRLAQTLGIDASLLSADQDDYTTCRGKQYLREGAEITLTLNDGQWAELDRPFNTTLKINDVKAFLGLELTKPNHTMQKAHTLEADNAREMGVLDKLARSAEGGFISRQEDGYEYLTESLTFYNTYDALVSAHRMFDDDETLETTHSVAVVEPQEELPVENDGYAVASSDLFIPEMTEGTTIRVSYDDDDYNESELVSWEGDTTLTSLTDDLAEVAMMLDEYDEQIFDLTSGQLRTLEEQQEARMQASLRTYRRSRRSGGASLEDTALSGSTTTGHSVSGKNNGIVLLED